MNKKIKSLSLLVLSGCMAGLTGCFGPGDDPTSSPTSAPTSAPTSEPTSAPTSAPTSDPTSDPTSTPTSAPATDFQVDVSLQSGLREMEVGKTDKILTTESGTLPDRITYSYYVSDDSVASVSTTGVVTALKAGSFDIAVLENSTGVIGRLNNVTVIPVQTNASGGYNFAAAAGEEAVARRTEILGNLEKYAMDSHLTGITLFENGGYVKYNPRLEIPATEYITGYGFGILSEGNTKYPLDTEQNENYKMYLHSASSSDPQTINALNNDGSQVSDLAGYITSSYWGTKMANDKKSYEWYPVLAKDNVGGKPFNRPVPVYEKANPLGLYNRWRIYVKTGAEDELKYSTLSTKMSKYNGRLVELADYEFIYQVLYTGSNILSRGSQMANDTSYGVKGALQFYNNTKNITDQAKIDELWNSMKEDGRLGIKTAKDTNGSYIELELVNPIDEFTAMYSLSSGLVSPLPRAFLEEIGDGSIKTGITRYGNFNNGGKDAVLDYTLCLGAYTLESWEYKGAIWFKQDPNWVERKTYPNRYRIPGVKIQIVTNATQNPNAIYDLFNNGYLDSCGIPVDYIAEELGKPNVYETKGDSTFKLNINSCSQETWDDLFGVNGKINKGSTWNVKPWMSNDDFLKGLFFSINRPEFAKKRGVQPSINYFSDAYLSDPEKGVSYNSTEAHQKAIADYNVIVDGVNQYGYDKEQAINCFRRAVNAMVKKGDIHYGETIEFDIKWMYASDIQEYGNDIKSYFESAFNDNRVSGGRVKLNVTQSTVTDWQQVYEEMRKGQFDLGFGAISGNTYNPLNFLEVLKSDNSSGFTLNWGTDTSVYDEKHPLHYDGQNWSFDALWAVSDHGGVVDECALVKSVKQAYLELPKTLDTKVATNELLNGATVDIPFEFVSVKDVEFEISNVQIYIVGQGNENLDFVVDKDAGVIHVTISKAKGEEWNTKMREVNKLTDDDPSPDPKPFVMGKYNMYWTIEIYYTISIGGGIPSQSYITAAKNKNTPLYPTV